MAAPSMTFNAAGNVRTSSSLAAGGTGNYNVDYSTVIEAQVTVKNTPGGTIAATRGCRVNVFPRYGTGPSDTTLALLSYDLPSAVASTAESKTFFLGPGKYVVQVVNLDASNAITVEITDATVGLV